MLTTILSAYIWTQLHAERGVNLAASAAAHVQRQYINAFRIPQPSLNGPIAADSPNTALRLMHLYQSPDAPSKELYFACSQVRTDVTVFSIDRTMEDEETPLPTEADLEQKLEEVQPWIERFIAFEPTSHVDFLTSTHPFSQRLSNDDPRRNLVGSFRRSFVVVRADAIRLSAQGRHDEAGQRLLAILRVTRAFTAPDVQLTHALTAAAVQSSTRPLTEVLFATRPAAQLSDHLRAALLAELNAMNAADPALVREYWKHHVQEWLAFLDSETQNSQMTPRLTLALTESLVGEKWATELGRSLFSKHAFPAARSVLDSDLWDDAIDVQQQLESLTPKEIRHQLTLARSLFEQFNAAWSSDDPLTNFKPLTAQTTEGGQLLSMILGPPASLHRSAKSAAEARQRMIDLLNGAEPDPGDVKRSAARRANRAKQVPAPAPSQSTAAPD